MLKDHTVKELARMIDHSLLHPTITDEDVLKGCNLARRLGVATVCVKPYCVHEAVDALTGSGVGISSVVAFPHGNSSTAMKVAETNEALNAGSHEIDMVVNIGKVLGEDWDYVSGEIAAVNDVVLDSGCILKVIFENDYLQDFHIIRLCEICSEQYVAFVKTSTGYGFVKQVDGTYKYKGATDHHLRLMRKHSDPSVQIKAAGGVRTLADLLRVRTLGVTRVGATATESIINEAIEQMQ